MGGGHSLNARSDLTIASFVLNPFYYGNALAFGFSLDVKPQEEIFGLLFVLGVKKEEGSYTYL
jgi:hypothetical protein